MKVDDSVEIQTKIHYSLNLVIKYDINLVRNSGAWVHFTLPHQKNALAAAWYNLIALSNIPCWRPRCRTQSRTLLPISFS
jgi:hypothetical protein